MNVLYKRLHGSQKSQTILFVLISIVNVMIIGIFSKLMIEIDKIREETERISRDEELMMYFSMLIAISLMIILFSLWIMRIICQTVFESRKEFNIQLRMLGVTKQELSRIYVREFLGYQLPAILLGLGTAQAGYHVLSKILDISDRWIGVINMGAAVLLHLLTVLLCLAMTFRRITGFNPVEEMRSPYKTDRIRRLQPMDVITGAVGGALIVIGSASADQEGIFPILPIAGIFLLLDLLLVSMQYLLKNMAGLLGLRAWNLGQRNLLGYYKKVSPILTTLTVGIMISLGLLGMFETLRVISKDTVEQNIYFKELIVHSQVKEAWSQEDYEAAVKELDETAQIAYGINMEMLDEEGITNTVYAIDEAYLQYGEKVVLTDGSSPAAKLESPSFDGIYLPDYFVSDEDVGKPYPLSINGNTVELKIAGRFVANGSRGRYGFISKSYLQSVMGSDMINALYIHEADDSLLSAMEEHENVLDSYIVTKEEIASNSYENAINGVEIFEIAAFMIVVISFFMFVHFSLSSARQNVFDITRLRAMGVEKGTARKAYIYQVMYLFTTAFLIGGILAFLFIRVGVEMSGGFVDVPVRICFPFPVLFGIYAALLAGGSITAYVSTDRAFRSNITGNLTVAE